MAYWIFSNKQDGTYAGNVWDMAKIRDSGRYSIRESEKNRKRVNIGDTVYMRIYGRSIIGKFVVGSEWEKAPKEEQKWKNVLGYFQMTEIEWWSRTLPQVLILNDLSVKDFRSRITAMTKEDSIMVEVAHRVYARLGFGEADDNIMILEKGLEEAIKPNLGQLGLRLAGKGIQQQFRMGLGVGQSDLVCQDENDDLVVIEIKKGMTSDQALGQLMRYVGWLQENVAVKGQKVNGWIVAGDYDEQLRLAAKAANVRLVLVRLG